MGCHFLLQYLYIIYSFSDLFSLSNLPWISFFTPNQKIPLQKNTQELPKLKKNLEPSLNPKTALAIVSPDADSNRNFSVLFYWDRHVN